MNKFERIMIFGRPGSGKSTFAYKLHNKTGIPLYHLDKYFFEYNWIERDYQEFLDIQQDISSRETWIIDGNATKSLEVRWQKADLVLYFNYPRWICYWRVFKRLFTKDISIKDRAPGCQEAVRWSLIKYMWNFNKRVASKIKDLKSKYPSTTFIEIKSDKYLKILQVKFY